jgi:oxygen-independent coproporphyrinogen III oxidase
MSGIYLHIPFCKQACTYCDFFFTTRSELKPAFLKSLLAEIGHYRGARAALRPIRTVYFGGGTPSRLAPEELAAIMQALRSVFRLGDVAEITVEVNPDDLTPEWLGEARQAGVNRLSVGIQTFNPERLRFMNRAHTRNHALACLEMIRKADFPTWTADLIYGNPGQDTADLEKDADTLLAFDPPHISAYSLTVEPHTRLGSMVRKNLVVPAEDDVVAGHAQRLYERLGEAGIERYEVSNYARPGHEAVHNSAYWSHSNYIGLGPGAHSFEWKEGEQTARRWSNRPHLPEYLKKVPNPHEEEILDAEQLATERLMMGVRTRDGVSFAEMQNRYGYGFGGPRAEVMKGFIRRGLIEDWPGGIRLTPAGMLVADRITLELVSRDEG